MWCSVTPRSGYRKPWQERWGIRHCCHLVPGDTLTCMRTVLIVLFDGVQSLDVTGPLEVFAGANRGPSGRDHNPASPDRPAYLIRTASLAGRPVRTSSGLRLTPDLSLTDQAPDRP